MLILVQNKNNPDQTHIFQDTFSKSFSVHQLATMYNFHHTSQDIHPAFLL